MVQKLLQNFFPIGLDILIAAARLQVALGWIFSGWIHRILEALLLHCKVNFHVEEKKRHRKRKKAKPIFVKNRYFVKKTKCGE